MEKINELLWGKEMIVLLLGISLYFMLRTGFILYRHPLRLLSQIRHGKGGFTSLCNALASSLGVGSVSGVGTALMLGGSGALVWMMISAFFGMMLKYAEIIAALQVQKEHHQKLMAGCMMIFHSKGIPILGGLFALCCIAASFGIGNLAPMQAMKEAVFEPMNVPMPCIAMVFMFFLYICLGKGGRRIRALNEKLVPLASIFYVGACLYLLGLYRAQLLDVIADAFVNAFSWRSIGAGSGGYLMSRAMRYGMSRGVFSHEAGMGSSPLAFGAEKPEDAFTFGLLGMAEVFFDTLVVCLLSGLVLLSSNTMHLSIEGSAWMRYCFLEGFGSAGALLYGCVICLFALPCMLGWFAYGSTCIRYFSASELAQKLYLIAYLAVCGGGLIHASPLVFQWCDLTNGLMIVPNLISLMILRKSVIKLTQEKMKACVIK